jgi:hypothetical protein
MDLARPDKVRCGLTPWSGALLIRGGRLAPTPSTPKLSNVLLFPPEVGVVFNCDSTVSFTTAPTRRVLSAWLLFTPFVQ